MLTISIWRKSTDFYFVQFQIILNFEILMEKYFIFHKHRLQSL